MSAVFVAAPAQIPILCRRCFGAAAPLPDGEIECPYCGQRDRLPPDELGRALELRRRLSAARGAAATVSGMHAALAHLFESTRAFWRVAILYLVTAVLAAAYGLWQAWPAAAVAPAGARVGILVTSLWGGMWIFGLMVAAFVSFLIGRRTYRRSVRGHLLARAPRAPGAPARCRVCDGALPQNAEAATSAFLHCAFCSTTNLVTAELAQRRTELLESERSFHAARASAALGGVNRVSARMSRTMTIAAVVTYAAMIGAATLLARLSP